VLTATAASLFHIVATHQFRVTAGYIAAGWTVSGVVLLAIWQWQRAERARTFTEVTTEEEGDAGGALGMLFDYGIATVLCVLLLEGGAALGSYLTHLAARWSISPPLLHTIVTHAYVSGWSLVFSVVLSGAAITLMSRAFEVDWHLSRTWNFALLPGPFLLAALFDGWYWPTLWTGFAAHIATLFAGWRWTDAPPAGLLPTFRNVQNARELARLNARGSIPAHSGDPGDKRVAAARRGVVLCASQDGSDVSIQEGPATLIYSATTVSLLTKESTFSYDLAEVTQIGFADPATLQLRIGEHPELVIKWRDRAKAGALPFATRLAAAREQRMPSQANQGRGPTCS
jgi:hypothetical protein